MPNDQAAALYALVDADAEANAEAAALYALVDADAEASAQVAALYLLVDAIPLPPGGTWYNRAQQQ